MDSAENKWVRPEIIIFERSNSQEMVLSICKVNDPNAPGGGSNGTHNKCASGDKNCHACTGEGGGFS